MSNAPARFDDHPTRHVGVRFWAAAVLASVAAVVVAWSLMPSPLPEIVRVGTGPSAGYYARFADALRAEAARQGIELELVATTGSMENIRLLLNGEIDVGLVQSGTLSDTEATRLASVASVFYELVLVVQRADWDSDHIEGGRIAVGVPGSGAHALARSLLEDQGVGDGVPPGTRFVEVGGQRAVETLRAGEVDSGVFVTSLDLPWVRTLFTDPGLRVTHFTTAEAFTRHYPYLRQIVIPAGLIDLRAEIPSQDVAVIATTASLVIRPGAHRALIPLLIASAQQHLFEGGLLAGPGEFPSAHGVDAPLAEEAREYFERGPSFFYRWLPFRYAFAATRLTIILIPLLTLLYPLFRSAGPAYRWIVERRINRWYRVLEEIDRKMDAQGDSAIRQSVERELERVDEAIRGTHVPASYAANLFALRAHHRLLVDRFASLESAPPPS